MSGFEIAGIVLGTLPILIPAIEHIRQNLSTRRYDQQLQSLARNLKTEQIKLQNVCEKLLDGLVPPSQIQAMISQPMGDLWREEDTARKIRARLWDRDSYEAFETTIGSIRDSVDSLAEKVNAQRERQSSLLKRGVFALQRSSYTETLSDIKDGVASLVTLTSQSVELEPSRRVRSQGRFLTILQNLSRSLYRAMQSSLTSCNCYHNVGLKLENRKAVVNPLDSEDEITRDLEFRVSVSCDADRPNGEPSWRNVLVKTMSSTSTRSVDKVIEPPPPNKKSKGKKTVSFGASHFRTTISTSTTTTSTTTRTATLVQTTLMHSLPMSLSAVETSLSLCAQLQATQNQAQAQIRQDCGMIVDATRKYAVYPVHTNTTPNPCTRSTISLREILKGNNQSTYLSCRDRLQIAVIVSSSIVQLHGSPWLLTTLTSRDIHFFVDHNGDVAMSTGDPVLVKRLASSVPTITVAADAAPQAVVMNRNPALLSLAYLLLELVLEGTLDSFGTGAGGNENNVLSDYSAAQWALEKATFPSENYRSAVSRCLQGGLHKPGLGFESEDFCHEFYAGVIALLEKDLENA